MPYIFNLRSNLKTKISGLKCIWFSQTLRTLEDLINKYENELAEKDRKIDLLLTANREITYSSKSREYNQPKII